MTGFQRFRPVNFSDSVWTLEESGYSFSLHGISSIIRFRDLLKFLLNILDIDE